MQPDRYTNLRAGIERARAAGRMGRPSKVPPEIRALMRAQRDAGWTHVEIAAALNREKVPTSQGAACWSPATVGRMLKRMDRAGADQPACGDPVEVGRRPDLGRTRRRPTPTGDDITAIQELYTAGEMTVREIADRFGTTRSRIYEILDPATTGQRPNSPNKNKNERR
jgi:transposase